MGRNRKEPAWEKPRYCEICGQRLCYMNKTKRCWFHSEAKDAGWERREGIRCLGPAAGNRSDFEGR